jgi:hypothetical protein
MQPFIDVDHQNMTSRLNELNGVAQNIMNAQTTLNGATAKTYTVAQLLGGIIVRTGITSATVADVTPTAAAIVAAMPRCAVGDTFELSIINNDATAAAFSLSGGSGVTLTYLGGSGGAGIPPMQQRTYCGIVTNATPGSEAVSLLTYQQSPVTSLVAAQYSTAALQSAVIPAANLAGANNVSFENTGTTPGNLQLDTAANIIAAISHPQIGFTYDLEIRNSSGSANTATITTNTGITLHGAMTIAQTVTRFFKVRLTTLTTIDVYSMGITAAAA